MFKVIFHVHIVAAVHSHAAQSGLTQTNLASTAEILGMQCFARAMSLVSGETKTRSLFVLWNSSAVRPLCA